MSDSFLSWSKDDKIDLLTLMISLLAFSQSQTFLVQH